MRDIVKTLVEAGWSVGEEILDPGGRIDECLVTLLSPRSFEAEQFLTLRHHIEHVYRGSGAAVIAVSSPGSGDGKTTTAINLAGALSQRPDSRILLIDADFRAPAVAARLGMRGEATPGLVGALLDPHLALDDVVRRRMPYNLTVLLAGEGTPAPYELLKSARLGELLDAARRLYEVVILDTPPLVPFPDCRAIARRVDGVFIVVAVGLVWNNDDRRDRYHYYDYGTGRRHRVRSLGRLA
jgi:capsular exopolysaccharide synthesis family protein